MKVRRSLSIDPDVWHQTQSHARREERSASYVAEKALREYLARIDTPPSKERKTKRVPKQLEAAADQSS